jgi:hypothetical protein
MTRRFSMLCHSCPPFLPVGAAIPSEACERYTTFPLRFLNRIGYIVAILMSRSLSSRQMALKLRAY